MKKKLSAVLTTLLLLSVLAFSGCSKNGNIDVDNDGGDTIIENESIETNTLTPTNEPEKNTDEAIEWKENAEFYFTTDGLNFQITANKAAVAYLRNDSDELAQYLLDQSYDTGLSEENENIFSNLEYMVLMLPDPSIKAIDNDGIYTAIYQFAVIDQDMLTYLDIELKKTDGGWKVVSIGLQG